ncbi:hypothetical protein BV22DRAFT_227435 [Leucogyrophana mollusca]|uniref:Uncharacterized protein n=1 Tax=Leucogyrophana mollusca TaxID=85980 RepID=A0ACB8BQA0_9AGAM|nr:hypothetical protein BV22DRAFT_227435 [Leucogyrophana mollusca]
MHRFYGLLYTFWRMGRSLDFSSRSRCESPTGRYITLTCFHHPALICLYVPHVFAYITMFQDIDAPCNFTPHYRPVSSPQQFGTADLRRVILHIGYDK